MMRRSPLTALVLAICGGVLGASGLASCAPDKGNSDSTEQATSGARAVQTVISVYRRLVGRDPTAEEITKLKGMNLGDMTTAVLDSPEFEQDGFFGLLRDRFLLHRQGDQNWLDNSLPDYCAMKLEVQDVARADKSGGGYFELVRYRDRWVPLSTGGALTAKACFFGGLTAGQIVAAKADSTASGVTDAARDCIKDLDAETPEAFTGLDTAPKDKPFLTTAQGQAALLKVIGKRQYTTETGPVSGLELPGATPGAIPTIRKLSVANADCATENITSLDTATADSTVFVKVRVPEALEGIHASGYWLSRHPTTTKNQSLHRARVVFFSHMCTEISPNEAASGGGAAVAIPALTDYFSPTDQHALGSGSCYNCHTTIQPVANYFGELTLGAAYNESPTTFSAGSLFAGDRGFRRPGGLWRGTDFFASGKGEYGMAGLASLLANYDLVASCVARSAWASLVGPDFPLTDPERDAAVTAFRDGGTPRLRQLMKHLIATNARGKKYFEEGEKTIETAKAVPTEDCSNDAKPRETDADVPTKLLPENCASCHKSGQRTFFEKTKEWKPTLSVGTGKRYASEAALLHTAYCAVANDSMPSGGYDDSLAPKEAERKEKMACWLAARRNELALASDDDAIKRYARLACGTTVGAAVPPNGELGAVHSLVSAETGDETTGTAGIGAAIGGSP